MNGASLFFAIPMLVSYFVARLCCLRSEGRWWVAGTLITFLGLAPKCLEDLTLCPLYGSCGTPVPYWLAATAVVPSIRWRDHTPTLTVSPSPSNLSG